MSRNQLTGVVRANLPVLAIGVALCSAGMLLWVEPVSVKLAEAHRKVDALQRAIAAQHAQPQTAPSAGATPQAIEGAIDTLRKRSDFAADRTLAFSTVMNLAESSGIQVSQFQPGTPRARATPAAPARTPAEQAPRPGAAPTSSPPAPAKSPETRAAYTLPVGGTYSAITAFIRALQHDAGFTQVHAVRLSPAGSGDLLTATIETEHVALDLAAFNQRPEGQP
jgi:hypothetical protein